MEAEKCKCAKCDKCGMAMKACKCMKSADVVIDPGAPQTTVKSADPVERRTKKVQRQLIKLLDEVHKREFSAKEREHAADAGQAMPDGSFPIKTEQDLKNAIHALGRAKNPEAAKRHIKARARALGLSNLIPDTWKTAGADFHKAVAELAKAAVGRTKQTTQLSY